MPKGVPRTGLAKASAFLVVALALRPERSDAQTINSDVMRERPVPVEDELKQQLDEARWGLGPLRIDPYFKLGNVGYNNNIFGETTSNATSDLTASVSGGLGFITPLGTRAYIRGGAGASYDWYLEQTGLRRLAPTGNLEILALWNRVRFQAGASLSQANVITTSEVAAALPEEKRELRGTVSVEVFRRLSFVAGYRQTRIRLDAASDPGNYTNLDRDESVLRGGLEYAFRSYLHIGVAAEKAETRFEDYSNNADFDATNYLVTAGYDQKKFFLHLEAGTSEVEPVESSTQAAYSEQTPIWGAFLSYLAGARTELRLFTSRRVQPSLSTVADFLVETRTGAGVGFRLGTRTTLNLQGEFGTNTYPVTQSISRPDQDVAKASAGVSFKVWRSARIGFTLTWEDYSSADDPRFDRRVFSGSINASF